MIKTPESIRDESNNVTAKVTTDGAIHVIDPASVRTQKIQNVTSGQPLYVGEADPGTAIATASWRIKKMEYDNGENAPPTGVLWAEGNTNFDKQWTLRTTYVYS